VVRIYAEKLKEMTGEEPFSIDKIIEFNLQAFPEPDPDSSDPLEPAKQQVSQFLGPFEEKVAIIKAQYTAFFVKFEEQAANGKLDKAKCVQISTECVLEVLLPLPATSCLMTGDERCRSSAGFRRYLLNRDDRGRHQGTRCHARPGPVQVDPPASASAYLVARDCRLSMNVETIWPLK
jgi:hypothetical protein